MATETGTKNRLIYQVYVGQPSKLYDHCIASVDKYCIKHKISHVTQKVPKLRIKPNPFTTNRSKEAVERLGYLPIYEKENAFEYFDRFDQIAIVDSDIWIRDNSPNIFDDLDSEYDFGGVVAFFFPHATTRMLLFSSLIILSFSREVIRKLVHEYVQLQIVKPQNSSCSIVEVCEFHHYCH